MPIQKILKQSWHSKFFFPKCITPPSEFVFVGWKVFLEFLIIFFHYFQSTNIWKLVPKQDLKILFMTGVTCCTREHWQRWNNQMKQMKRKLWPSGKEVEKIFLKLKEKMWKGRKINLKERKQIWFKCQYLNLSQMRETE